MAENYPPEVQEQRRMLEQRRDDLRREGFAAVIQLEVLKAQRFAEKAEQDVAAKEQTRLQALARNAYSAARRLEELLAEIGDAPQSAD